MSTISKDINKAIDVLKKNDLVAIPTETVYGLAGNIFSDIAVRKIFSLKGRPFYNPLIVHTHSIEQLKNIISKLPEEAKQLGDAFWPGPLTLILPKHPAIPDLVTAGKDTVGVRIPNHPLTLELLRALDFPLAAPSANTFGNISPTQPEHVEKYFGDKLHMVLDGGNCQKGIESTIVGFEKEKVIIYRLGAISIEEIEGIVGPVQVINKSENKPDAPGMLSRHYAPRTKTILVDDLAKYLANNPLTNIGVLSLNSQVESKAITAIAILSSAGDLKEAASNLYAALHRLDGMKLDIIIAQKMPDHGIGKSINDRLERATKNE